MANSTLLSEHRLKAVRENLHGTYFHENRPVLRVKSGDVINFETLEVGWRTERVLPDKDLKRVPLRDPVTDDGPALTGPVYVEGAAPGTTLEVRFLGFRSCGWGWTSAGGKDHRIPELKGVDKEKCSLFWEIDDKHQVVTDQWGNEVNFEPFLGCVGLASADPLRRPGWAPHPRTGGNLDANVLVQGTSLFLPVEVKGGLLSVGDAHASQGEGEVSGTAIECALEEARLQVVVHPDRSIAAPRALCGERWVTFGVAETLDEAAVLALEGMLDVMTEDSDMSRSRALALAGTFVDLRVTQMVNPLKGMHAILTVPLQSLT